jgi:hypothetical protein
MKQLVSPKQRTASRDTLRDTPAIDCFSIASFLKDPIERQENIFLMARIA